MPAVAGPRDHRGIETADVDEDQLRDLRGDRERPVIDDRHVEQDRAVAEWREVRKRQRPAEGRRRLIDHAEQRQEEHPAPLGAGHVDDDRVHPHVRREEHRSQVEVRLDLFVEQVEQVPRDEAVDRDPGDQTQPGAERERPEARVNQGVVQERRGEQQREPEQPQAWHDQRVELDETRALAPFRLGGIDLQVEGGPEFHAFKLRIRADYPTG